MQLIQQSEATASLRRIFFQAVDATDGITAETGLTGAGRLSKAGAATAATTNNITEVDATNMPGRYYIELTATEVNTLGIVEFRFKTAACAEVVARGLVVAFDPFTATDLGITRLDAAVSSRSSHGDPDPSGFIDVAISSRSSHNAAAAADAVWDEARSGHSTAGTFGESFQGVVNAEAATGTLSTTQMTTNLTEATDDHYNGRIVVFITGNLAGQATDITDYTGLTKLITMTALTEAPSNGDRFVII